MEPSIMDSGLAKGDPVLRRSARDAVGTIAGPPRCVQGEWWYPVRFGAQLQQVLATDLERVVEETDLKSLLTSGRYGSHAALARRVTMSKLRRPLREAIYSLEASRTEFHAYQFRPLLKFLASEQQRLLIADEVGLGKTIEAGYILQELKARHASLDRVLIVCPAKLRAKWQREMWLRFNEKFEILDATGFCKHAGLRPDGTLAAGQQVQAIVSLESIRSKRALALLEEQPSRFDLLIVDEAHYCRNPDAKQHRAVRHLTLESEAVVFLSATPLHVGSENLFHLLRLLLPEEFDRLDVFQRRLRTNRSIVEAETLVRKATPETLQAALRALTDLERSWEGQRVTGHRLYMETKQRLEACTADNRPEIVAVQESLSQLNLFSHIITRTKRRDVQTRPPQRVPHVVDVEMSPEEEQAYHALSQFCFDWFTDNRGDFAARFASIMLQRQLASSIPATLLHYQEAAATAAQVPDTQEDDPDEDWEEDTDVDIMPPTLKMAEDPEFARLIGCHLGPVLRSRDGKCVALLRVLQQQVRQQGEKVIVFSYFRRTLRYLEERLLKEGYRCVRIDGSVKSTPQNPDEDERGQRIAAFRDDPEVQVLLSSEVGSEGLDFQFCHTLVNWDLPWNPMVVEQRIGRLDRLGQRSEKILIFNLSLKKTIEDQILHRLYQRVGLFEGVIGPLEPILGGRIKRLTERLFDAQLTEQERTNLIEQEALALEHRRMEEEKLEAQSPNLIGHDEVFTQQIERTRRLGRYVSAAELAEFLGDFLRKTFPECALRPRRAGPAQRDAGEGCHWLRVTADLREFLRQHLPLTDPALLSFLAKASGDLPVTCDHAVAREHPQVEYLQVRHPLVRAVAKFYEDHPDQLHRAAAVEVSTADIPEGDYFLLWALARETGLMAGDSLWVEAVSVDGAAFLSSDKAEQLLHQVVVQGRTWGGFIPPEHGVSELYAACEDKVFRRANGRQHELERQSEALVDARMASLQASYEAKRAQREQNLQTQVARGHKRVIPMFEAALRKLDAEYEDRRRELEAKRKTGVSHSLEGGGFVRVIAPTAV